MKQLMIKRKRENKGKRKKNNFNEQETVKLGGEKILFILQR